MDRKRRTAFIRACRRKRNYTEEKASSVVYYKNKKGEYYTKYKCPICGNWHLSHISKKNRVYVAFKRLERLRQQLS